MENDPIQRGATLYLAWAYYYAGDYTNAEATADLYNKNWGRGGGGRRPMETLRLLSQLETNQTISNAADFPVVEILLKFKT